MVIKIVKNENGFSLIELLTIVAIVGMLTSIAIPSYQQFAGKARQVEAKAALSGIYTAEMSAAVVFSDHSFSIS